MSELSDSDRVFGRHLNSWTTPILVFLGAQVCCSDSKLVCIEPHQNRKPQQYPFMVLTPTIFRAMMR